MMAQPTELPAEIDLWREVEVVQNGQTKIYYHNTKTNDVSWNIPTTQWRKVKSSEGKLYYVNSSSLATSWAAPPECTLIVEFFATKALSRSLPPSPTAHTSSASTSGSSPTNVSHTASSSCSHHSHHCHHCHHHHKKRSPKQSPHVSPKHSPHTSPKHKTRSVRGHSNTTSSASSASISSISSSSLSSASSPSLSSISSITPSSSSSSSSSSSAPPSPPPLPIPPTTVGGAFAPPSPHSLPPVPTPPSTAPPPLTPTPPPTPPPVLVALLPSYSPVPPALLPTTPTGQQSLSPPQPPILPSPPRDRPPSPSPQTLSVGRGSPFKGLGPPPPPPPLPPLFNPTTPQGPISDSPKFFPTQSPSLQQKASQEGVSCIDCRLYGGAGRCPMHRTKQSPEKGVAASQIQTDLPDPLEEDDKSFALDNSGNGSTTSTTVTVTQPRGSNELNNLESKTIAGSNMRTPYKGDLKSLNNLATFSIKKAATLKQAKGYKKKFDEYWFSVTAKGRIEYFKDPGMSKKLGRLLCNQSIVTQIDKSDGEFLFTVRDQKFNVYQAPSKKERDEWLYIFQDHGADVRPILIQGVLVEAPKKGKEVPRWGVLYKKKFQYFKSRSDELPLGEINFTASSALKIHPGSDQSNGTSVVAGTRKFTILGEGGEKNSFDGWASSVEEEKKWFDILTLIMDSKATRRVQVEVLDGKDFSTEHSYCSVLPVREDPITNKITEVREELQKTPVAEGPGDPVWNTAMVFRSNIPEKGSLLFRVKSKKGVQTVHLGEATLAYDFTKPNPGRVESWLLLQAPRRGTLKGAERFGSIRISLLLCEPKTSPPLQPQRMTLKVQSSPQQARKKSEDIEE